MEIRIKFYFKVDNGNSFKETRFLHNLCDIIILLKRDGNLIRQIGNIIIDGNPIWMWIYNTTDISRDDRILLQGLLEQIPLEKEEISNEELMRIFDNANKDSPKGLVGDSNELVQHIGNKYVSNEKEYYELKQYYAKQFNNKTLYKYLPECFMELAFDCTKESYNFDKYSNQDVEEVFKILNFLNYEGKKIFNELLRNVDTTIKKFNATNGFRCSGGKSIKKVVKINGNDHELDFTAHFKIQTAYSNKRLYFSWGNDNVKKIVIGYIGKHWE